MGGPTKRGSTEDAGALRRARAVLEVAADADVSELTRAYWRQARRLHPDRSSDPDANQQFQALHDAYRLALDMVPDATLRQAPHPSGESPGQGEPGVNEGVWVVAGPVHVQPIPPLDTTISPREGRP